jgi:hypothetical protein
MAEDNFKNVKTMSLLQLIVDSRMLAERRSESDWEN